MGTRLSRPRWINPLDSNAFACEFPMQQKERMTMRRFKTMAGILCLSLACLAEVTVSNVKAVPRWPWNGKVDISFSIESNDTNPDGTPVVYHIQYQGHDQDTGRTLEMTSLSGDGVPSFSLPEGAPYPAGGPYKVVWDAKADYPKLNSSAFKISVTASRFFPFLIVNLETGEVRVPMENPDLNDDTCRTTELWLRWIPAGTFTMGSPEDELGKSSDETQHEVTLTQGYYIGVFEVTQKQWELVMGGNPSYYKGDTRPVERVSYNSIRGSNSGAGWPSGGHAVDSDSFLGKLREKLREKTGEWLFELPTEAQWEYACRAGTTTALNSGKNLTDYCECPNMAEVGRYGYNRGDGKGGYSEHTKVGSYLPNAWGLYDMHGNVDEWCLDWYGSYPTGPVSDPTGAASNWGRVLRGGRLGDDYYACYCRSANRYSYDPSRSDDGYLRYRGSYFGFRIVCIPPGQ